MERDLLPRLDNGGIINEPSLDSRFFNSLFELIVGGSPKSLWQTKGKLNDSRVKSTDIVPI